MAPTIKQIIKDAIHEPLVGLPILASESREAIRNNDLERARPLVMTLLSLSIERSMTNAADRDLVEWLLGQGTSLQLVLRAVLFARKIGDLPLEQRALSLAPTAPLAS